MKALAIAAVATGLACAPGQETRPGGGTAQLLEGLERARFAAVVARDTAALRRYLAPDLTYTHSSGAVETREDFLARLASGELDYRSIEPSELQVRVLGEGAVIVGRATLVVRLDTFAIRFTDVWRRRERTWQMVAWQATRLPQQ